MDTYVRTPQEIFLLPQQLVVPPFQRPYVWNKDDQWVPLWQDVRRLAEARSSDPLSTPSHFLGAVVIQAQDQVLGNMQVGAIIDGQQRMTTLQLLMDAASAILEEAGQDDLANQLGMLTHNQAMYATGATTQLKLRHTNRDQAAFDEVMDAEPPIEHGALKHSGALVVQAHEYFGQTVSEWLGSPENQAFRPRAEGLVYALSRGIQLVVINLAANENSQEIFETLNARGTPLTAADLIKNFVFQRLAAEGVDTKRAYAEGWPFETKFWETEVSVGRYLISRSSLFFNQWLVSRVGEEIGPKSTFQRFKRYVDAESGHKLKDLLPVITEQAALYESWTLHAEQADRQLTPVEMAAYRMRATDTEVLQPLLLWLHEPGRALPTAVVEQVVAAAESWVVRRQLLRLSGSDLGRIVADVITAQKAAPADKLAVRVTNQLAALNAASTYWPGDEEIRTALRTEQVYRRFRRGRMRMLLEAIEDIHRAQTNQPQVPRRGYPIEHILPQSWQGHWPVDSPEAEAERADHVHRLGNLTLVTTSLNSKVSNGPWTTKRSALQAHDTLLLNSRLLAELSDAPWDESTIDVRTDVSLDAILRTWPVPEGHVGAIVAPATSSKAGVGLPQLMKAGLLAPGTVLTPRAGQWQSHNALVRANAKLEVNGQVFDTPSGAGCFVRGGSTNGWHFWRMPDGRKLLELRAALN